ncbi:Ethylene-dependent gravitropism-deficient and yellow-green-like 2 isoform, partial [Thalictrum thalictroides]
MSTRSFANRFTEISTGKMTWLIHIVGNWQVLKKLLQKDDNLEVASGSPLPGLKQQGEPISIPKETIDILKDQVFGFDTFFVTSQEPYE